VAVVPFPAGLVAQYVLGLSPVGMKLCNYSTTLLGTTVPHVLSIQSMCKG
jgi:hypothetical protein